mgnify:CR=1 FL=1
MVTMGGMTMKITRTIFIAALSMMAAAAVSCQKDELRSQEELPVVEMTLDAATEASAASTKLTPSYVPKTGDLIMIHHRPRFSTNYYYVYSYYSDLVVSVGVSGFEISTEDTTNLQILSSNENS